MTDDGAFGSFYPFRSHWLDLDGIKLHYVDEGKGETVVMLHGNPSWSFMYRDLIKALRGHRRVIAPDHVGCGLSDKPGDDRYEYTLERRVEDLDRLLKKTSGSDPVTLVLHDWGGMIGMAWARRHPERVKRLVIFNTAAFLLPDGKPLPAALRVCRDSEAGAFLVRAFNAFAWTASRVGVKRRPMAPEVRRAYLAPYDSWANRIATLRFVQDIPLMPCDRAWPLARAVQDDLDRFASVPTLICWGLKDFVFDRDFLAAWRRRFPRAQVREIPDAGHYVVEDAPEIVIPLVQDFLARNRLTESSGRSA